MRLRATKRTMVGTLNLLATIACFACLLPNISVNGFTINNILLLGRHPTMKLASSRPLVMNGTFGSFFRVASKNARLGASRLFSSVREGRDAEKTNSSPLPSSIIKTTTTDRRTFLSSSSTIATTAVAAATFLSLTSRPLPSQAQDVTVSNNKKVLVLGGTGFVGSRIVSLLKSVKNVNVVATSRDGRDGTEALDVTSDSTNILSRIEQLARGCDAVISTIGSIGTNDDERINAASGLAAVAAKNAGVKTFVYIAVSPDVASAAQGIGPLKPYLSGKASSVEYIRNNFSSDDGKSYTILSPTFIYGGSDFKLNPPRVAEGYGKVIETILSSVPMRAASGVSPGLIKVALEPPISVDVVAKAAMAGALFGGTSDGAVATGDLDTYDKILEASKLI